jgi:hypothetical protein
MANATKDGKKCDVVESSNPALVRSFLKKVLNGIFCGKRIYFAFATVLLRLVKNGVDP